MLYILPMIRILQQSNIIKNKEKLVSGRDKKMAQIRFPQLPSHAPARGSKLSRTFFRQLFLAQGWRLEGEFPDLPKAVAIISPHTSNIDAWLGFNALLGLGIQIT